MKLKTLFATLVLLCTLLGLFCGCGSVSDENSVVIYSSAEDYINQYFTERLNEKFPDYNITIEYLSTGENAAKLKAEGTDSPCDIVWGLEVGYLDDLTATLADVPSYDTSDYVSDMQMGNGKYLVAHRYSGCVVVNTDLLAEKGLPVPQSYQDLLDPAYKNLIAMPNPKSSGTGYIYLKRLVNAWGEEEAFAYFDKLSENVLQFTSSGSGPINALVQGEIAIAMGMTSQAVIEINNAQPFQILFFEEGAPFTACGYGIVSGKENKTAVTEVFDFFRNELIHREKELYLPEKIFEGQENTIENYPKDIPYSDMQGNTAEEKQRLLDMWIY